MMAFIKQKVISVLYNIYNLKNPKMPKVPEKKIIGILFCSSPKKNIPLGEFIIREPFFRYLYTKKNKLFLISDDPFGDQILGVYPFHKYFIKRISINQEIKNFDVILDLQNFRFSKIEYKKLFEKTNNIYAIGNKEKLLAPYLWEYLSYLSTPIINNRHELQRAFDIFGVICNFNKSQFIPRIEYKKKKILYDYAINLFDINSTKSWNTNQIIEFIKKNENKRIVLIGDNSAKNQEKQILYKARVKSFVGKLNINRLIDIIAKSKVIITPDTGTAHLAAAMDKKIIVLYGPTELVRWKPLNKKTIQIYNKFGCKDCRETRFCKKGTRECMNIRLEGY